MTMLRARFGGALARLGRGLRQTAAVATEGARLQQGAFMSPETERAESIALLDLLIDDQRSRVHAVQARLAAIQFAMGTVTTAVAAIAAFLAAQLHPSTWGALSRASLAVSVLAAVYVLVLWIDALVGPTKGLLAERREPVTAAEDMYMAASDKRDALAVREALLALLMAEKAFAHGELKPRERQFRAARVLMIVALLALALALATR